MPRRSRKESTRPRRTTRRVRRKLTVARPIRQTPQLSFTRTFWYQNWTPSTVATSNFYRQWSFQLAFMPQYTEFSNIFDQYRINAIKCVFRPRYDGFSGNDTTDTTLPGVTNQAGTKLHVIVDPKANITPVGAYNNGTLNTMLENGRVKTYSGNRDVTVFFKPMVNNNVGGLNAGRRIKAPWMQCATADAVDHYGFYIFAQDINFTGVFGQSWDMFITYYLQFKDLRSA